MLEKRQELFFGIDTIRELPGWIQFAKCEGSRGVILLIPVRQIEIQPEESVVRPIPELVVPAGVTVEIIRAGIDGIFKGINGRPELIPYHVSYVFIHVCSPAYRPRRNCSRITKSL
jgi:hypothetical protein